MRELVDQILPLYLTNADILLPIFITIFICGISLGASMLGEDRLMRTALVGVVALAFIALSFTDFLENPFANELFRNLGTMFLLSLIALVYAGLAATAHDWIYPVYAATGLTIFALLFVNRDNPTSDLAGNLAAMFIAAWPAAYIVRKQWQWSPEKRERKLTAQLRSSRKQRVIDELNTPDFTVLVQGMDQGALAQKLTFLRESDLKILDSQAPQYDELADVHYQMVQAKITTAVKDQDVTLMDSNVAQLRILAYPDVAKRVYKQITEVVEENSRQRLDGPPQLAHLQLTVQPPEQLFSEYLEQQIFELARQWRYGDDEQLGAATEALLDWAQEMHFIRPTN